ncbi:DUF2894 domain-containing protein [Limnohabitans sp. Rim28]|uniref:DUF2894 domain-containing protein n=1 Tax=Limnohabitans sp. Rim28 TaxID=1100720 RepID=UPI00030A2D36|nr:DUF2894 domain-containing protein [Limnohabitans sp. Rim28]PVE09458.1 hypothetical protein B472_01120 [Limnohabitans sp. Rim28]
MTNATSPRPALATLDPVGWHYTEQLAQRASEATGLTRDLLLAKLEKTLAEMNARWDAKTLNGEPDAAPHAEAALPSPLAQLLQEMTPASVETRPSQPNTWRAESPRLQQFRKQLGQISVQKQVSQAMAQAPKNAGPINSHMLVLRSLRLMREASPDYLGRFMVYLDTLLCLEEAVTAKTAARKASGTTAVKRQGLQSPS